MLMSTSIGCPYKSASRSKEYLVITGWGINDVKVAKKAWVVPGQRCTRIDISPVNGIFEVEAMTSDAEKVPLIVDYTVGPRANDKECLLRYAKLISSHDKLSHDVNELVKGVIERETRVLAASTTMEEIFRGTISFEQVVQLKLNQFGLIMSEFNVKRNGLMRQNSAKVKPEEKVLEKAEVTMKTGWEQKARVAEVEAGLQVEVAARQTERKLKAEQHSKTILDYNRQKAPEALLFEQEKEAEQLTKDTVQKETLVRNAFVPYIASSMCFMRRAGTSDDSLLDRNSL